VLLLGTKQLQAIRVICRVWLASSITNSRLTAPVLPSSLKKQGSGLQINAIPADLTLSKFADDTKLGGMANTLEGCAAIQ